MKHVRTMTKTLPAPATVEWIKQSFKIAWYCYVNALWEWSGSFDIRDIPGPGASGCDGFDG